MNKPLCRNAKRFRGGLVFKAHRLLYHSTLGWIVTKKKKERCMCNEARSARCMQQGAVWVYELDGHIRLQDYEGSNADFT